MDKIKPYLWLITPYFFFVSIVYLISYWSAFDINVFQYASFMDVIVMCIKPIFFMVLLTIAGGIIGLSIPKNTSGSDEYNGSEQDIESHYTEFIPYLKTILKLVPFIFFGLLPSILDGNFWPCIMLSGIIPYWLVLNSSFLNDIPVIPRALSILVVVFLPLSMVLTGKNDALKILNGDSYLYTDFEQEKIILVGHIGDKNLYVNELNTRIAIINDDDSPVFLNRFKKPFDYWGLKKYFH